LPADEPHVERQARGNLDRLGRVLVLLRRRPRCSGRRGHLRER
jgi:hypothetical protein